jgi:phosphohistidine phosphatase
MARPLTAAGRRSAKEAFRHLARVMKRPDLIMTSEAVRSRETAEILRKAFGRSKARASSLLNPGADFRRFRELVNELPANVEFVALVGHEPDISRIVARAVGSMQMDIRVKKGACVEIEIDRACRTGELRLLVHPEMLMAQRGGRRA